jgi:hypothetical protein
LKSRNQLKKIFNDFADTHIQINTFGYGQEFEQQALEGVVYPLLWVIPTAYQISGVDNNYSYQVLIADRVRKDETNEVDVDSDMDIVMKDLIAYLYKYTRQNELELPDSFTINPFWEKWSDEVTGVYTDIIIQDTFDYDACNLPIIDEIPTGDFPNLSGVYVSPNMVSKAITIPSPITTDNVPIFYTFNEISVRQINDVIEGTGQSVTYNIYYAASKDSATPSSLWQTDRTITTESGASTETFDNAVIPKDNWVWLEFQDVTGIVNIYSLNIFYKNIL